MGLHGKLMAAIEYRAGGDMFHELFSHRIHQLSTACPQKVRSCDLHEGEFGSVGSVISIKYTLDGKEKHAKHMIQSIDEGKKLIVSKVIEGDLMELHKDFIVTVQVETKGDIDLVTWTLEYEMLNEDVGHPIPELSYFIDLTKDIETHHTTGKP